MSAPAASIDSDVIYFNQAIKAVAETKSLLLEGRTIAQSPAAFRVMREAAVDCQRCGGHGWLFVFGDGSAVVSSNNPPDKIWSRWTV